MSNGKQRILVLYSATMSTIFGVLLLAGARPAESKKLGIITAERINIVEPDGTLRMVISNHSKLPGIIVKGKEQAFNRPQAGMIFYNDEGSENGGLIFGGRKNEKGEVVDAGGSLSFDKYGANEIVQLAGVHDSTDRFAGLAVSDENRRVWVGRTDDGLASVSLMDAKGRKRLSLEVKADGSPSIFFHDDKGAVIRKFTPEDVKP